MVCKSGPFLRIHSHESDGLIVEIDYFLGLVSFAPRCIKVRINLISLCISLLRAVESLIVVLRKSQAQDVPEKRPDLVLASLKLIFDLGIVGHHTVLLI